MRVYRLIENAAGERVVEEIEETVVPAPPPTIKSFPQGAGFAGGDKKPDDVTEEKPKKKG